MLKESSIPVYLFIGLLITLSIVFRSNQHPPVHSNQQTQQVSINSFSKIEVVKIPDATSFAGEIVPLHSFDVKERLDRELLVNTYWHSNTLQLFKLAARYFPTIERILEEQCVPDDFKYLALAESGLRSVISPSNAVGFWQCLESAGKENGLEINKDIDERYDIEQSTLAACRYLKRSYEEFGSWTLAAASYNMGKARVRKTISEQKVDSYYDLHMNDETSRYVFRIIALREIFDNPEQYGFYINKKDMYKPIPFKTITVENDINDLATFALENGSNYKTLRLMNPWIRQPHLKVKKGKSYQIKLPV